MTAFSRKAHVKRIFGKNADGTDNEDIYLDVLRADEIKFRIQPGAQDVIARLKWQDDGAEPQGNPTREIETVKVTDPQNPPDDPDNPDPYLPLDLIKIMKVWEGSQELRYRFHNETKDASGNPVETKRTVKKKRVIYAPTPDVDAILNAGGIVDFADYVRDEENVDKARYLDVEVIVRSPTTLRSDNQDITGVFKVAELFEPDGQFPQDDVPAVNDDGTEPLPPVRLDWVQNIVNVQLGSDVWVLVQVSGGPNFLSATQSTIANVHGDPVGTDIGLTTSADILYQRNTVIDDDPRYVSDSVVCWAGPREDNPGDTTISLQIVDGFSIEVTGFSDGMGGVTGVAVGVFAASDTAGIDAFLADHAAPLWTPHGPIPFTAHMTYVEAVYLLDKPREFTVSSSGFGVGMEIFIFPKSLVKLDATNTQWGMGGGDNAGQGSGAPRVWFPLAWRNDVPPLPKSPGNRNWPWPEGNWMVKPPPDDKDIINTAVFWASCNFDGGNPSWPFKVEKVLHWASRPPVADPSLADKMWVVYPTRVDAPAIPESSVNAWWAEGYTMAPLGEAFFAPSAWGLPDHLTVPGPLPLVPPETAG